MSRQTASGRQNISKVQNLIANSETYSGYTQTAVTLTANTTDTTDPFGNNNATKMTDIATTNAHRIFTTTGVLFGTYTLSAYVKAGTLSWFSIDINDNITAWFNVSNGTLGSAAGGVEGTILSTSITSVGNGWYRCAMVVKNLFGNLTFSAAFNLANANAALVYTGTGTGTAYLFGTQVINGNWAGPYTKTTGSTVNPNSPIRWLPLATRSNVAQSENLIEFSEAFTNGIYTASNATMTASTLANPLNGAVTASTFTDSVDGSPQAHVIENTTSNFTSGTYTISLYAKAIAGSNCWIVIGGDSVSSCYFNLNTGSFGSLANFSGLAFGSTNLGNGWYRIWTSFTNNTGSHGAPAIVSSTADGSLTYTGTGTQRFYLYGLQVNRASGPVIYAATTSSILSGPSRLIA